MLRDAVFFIVKRQLNVKRHYYDWRLGIHCMLLKMMVVGFQLILFFYHQKPKLTVNVLALCGPIIEPQPECSRCTCGKGTSAPAVWLGYRKLPIWFIFKASRQVSFLFSFFFLTSNNAYQAEAGCLDNLCNPVCRIGWPDTKKDTLQKFLPQKKRRRWIWTRRWLGCSSWMNNSMALPFCRERTGGKRATFIVVNSMADDSHARVPRCYQPYQPIYCERHVAMVFSAI